MRTRVGRYFVCSDLLAVIGVLLVTGVTAFAFFLTVGGLSVLASIPVGLLLYLLAAVVAYAALRRPGKSEPERVAGFAEIMSVRRRMRSGETLTPAEQQVADDLADICARRAAGGRAAGRVVLVLLLVSGAVFAYGYNLKDANAVLGAVATLAVVVAVVVSERSRASSIRRDLLATGGAPPPSS
ncbi:hypothetical protein [Lapillicoccus sp.]|uniref:hypothetical protein n=1 Tax=Lapillicoccus sp. TaxID=1909287 RepID=UPI0025D889FC|nr:hypothetical protein [Lapillicoccus sp.]